MKIKPLFILLLFVPFITEAQYKYGLTPVTHEKYLSSKTANPENELINLEKHIPGIKLDIRYATTNNFTKEKIYNLSRAYARKPVAESLRKPRKNSINLVSESKFLMPTDRMQLQ